MSRIGREELQRRAECAREMLRDCNLCPIRCGVNRLAGEKGLCALDERAWWFRENLNFLQEIELIPSHSIYLTGCNMRCDFCSVEDYILEPMRGKPWDVAELRTIVAERRRQGARTLLFVGGEATVQLHAVLDLLAALPERYKVVWDSNMLFTPEARGLLEGVVDVYAGDLKFGNNCCARKIAWSLGYLEMLAENLQFAESTASLIVRHLLLPGHFECCVLPMLEWLKRTLKQPRLSIRREYLPPIRLMGNGNLGHYVSENDFRSSANAAEKMGIELVA